MMIYLLLILSVARAEWFCTTQGSQVMGSHIESCGVGLGETEAQARLDAFDQARLEALRVGSATHPEPMRTECLRADEGYRCYRMVRFEMATQAAQNRPVIGGKVHKGMSKSDVYAVLGEPRSVIHQVLPERDQAFFQDSACVFGFCFAIFENGKMTYTDGLKPSFEE